MSQEICYLLLMIYEAIIFPSNILIKQWNQENSKILVIFIERAKQIWSSSFWIISQEIYMEVCSTG